MEQTGWIAIALFITDLLIRAGLSIRVIMRRLPVGVALAWLVLILVFPFVGALFYLLLGEYRLGPRRTRRAIAVRAQADAVLAARPPAADASCPPLDTKERHSPIWVNLFCEPHCCPGTNSTCCPTPRPLSRR